MVRCWKAISRVNLETWAAVTRCIRRELPRSSSRSITSYSLILTPHEREAHPRRLQIKRRHTHVITWLTRLCRCAHPITGDEIRNNKQPQCLPTWRLLPVTPNECVGLVFDVGYTGSEPRGTALPSARAVTTAWAGAQMYAAYHGASAATSSPFSADGGIRIRTRRIRRK
jgi:hypothetical protein